jgi:cation diffusion facilitator CzcD-associated flavoprotein CzcO
MYIDEDPFDISKAFVYKGAMLSGLPNLFIFVGYTNASWTLKSDLTSAYAARVFRFLNKKGYHSICPIVKDSNLKKTPLLNLNSGYINRAQHLLPSQGNKAPWRVYQNYILDYKMLRLDKINDGTVVFSR